METVRIMKDNKGELGFHTNISYDSNHFNVADRVNSAKTFKQRVRILYETRVYSLPYRTVIRILEDVLKDRERLMCKLMEMNQDLFLYNTMPNYELFYLREFNRRRDAQEDAKIRKDMIINMSILYEQKLVLFKEMNILGNSRRLLLLDISNDSKKMYSELLHLFQYDRKTQQTLNKIYPEIYCELKDKDVACRAIVDMFSETIRMNMDHRVVLNVLHRSIKELIKDGWEEEQLSYFNAEIAYYVKRCLYAMTSIEEVFDFVCHVSLLEDACVSDLEMSFIKMYIQCLDMVIEDHTFTTHIPEHTYANYENVNEVTEFMINKDSNHVYIRYNMNLLAELVLYINKLHENGEYFAKEIGTMNENFLRTFLVKDVEIYSCDEHIINLREYYKDMMNNPLEEIVEKLYGLCESVYEGLESYRRNMNKEVNSILRTEKVISITTNGWLTPSGEIDLSDCMTNKRNSMVRRIMGTKKEICDRAFDLNETRTSLKLNRSLYVIAEMLGVNYNHDKIHSFLKQFIFTRKIDKDDFMQSFAKVVFNVNPDELTIDSIYTIPGLSVLTSKTNLEYLDSDLVMQFLRLDVRKANFEDSMYINDSSDDDTFLLDDPNIEFDFEDLMDKEVVNINMMLPMQILRQMKYGKINIFMTSLHDSYIYYTFIIAMLNYFRN